MRGSNLLHTVTRRLSCAVAIVACAAAALAQEEQYRERQVLDPETGQWVDQPAEPATPQGELDEARSLLARGESGDALKLLKKWTEANPDHERHLEGMFLLGEAYFEEGDYYKAYESYDIVIQNSGGDLFFKAIRRDMDVARAFLSGQKRILRGHRDFVAPLEACCARTLKAPVDRIDRTADTRTAPPPP